MLRFVESRLALRLTLIGLAFACLSTSLGGTTVAFTRLIIADTDPLSLAFVRYGIAALVMLTALAPFVRLPRISRGDLAVLTLLGLLMFAGFPYFMARALEDTTAARGGLMFATMPVMTIIIGGLFRVEQLTAQKIFGVLIAGAGTIIALGERVDDIAPHALRGDLFMFIAMLSASTFNVFSKKYLVRYSNLPVMVYTSLIGVSALFVLALIFGEPFAGSLDFDVRGWGIVLMLAIPGGALMVYCWGRGTADDHADPGGRDGGAQSGGRNRDGGVASFGAGDAPRPHRLHPDRYRHRGRELSRPRYFAGRHPLLNIFRLFLAV